MIFWTILFLIYNIYRLFRGGRLNKLMVQIGEKQIKLQGKSENENMVGKEEAGKAILLFVKAIAITIFSIAYLVVYLIYLSFAISIAETTLFSLIMLIVLLVHLVYGLAKNKKVNMDLKTEEGKANYFNKWGSKRKFSSIVFSLLYVVYFAFMLIVLAN